MATLTEDLSEKMRKVADDIVKKVRDKSNYYRLDLYFTSKTQPKLRVQLEPEIDRLVIHQDYVKNYTDKIIVDIGVRLNEFVVLYYSRRDLKCRLQLKPYDPNLPLHDKRNDPPGAAGDLKTYNFRAVIVEYEDLFKKDPGRRIYPEYDYKPCDPKTRPETDTDRRTYHMKIELVPEEIVKARKEQMHAIFNQQTMFDVLKHTCNFFGIKTAYIKDPDNVEVYNNFVIPPGYGVESAVNFLQTAPGLGIYDDGCISYITRWWKKPNEMAWFIYPRYGTPECQNPITIYSIGRGKYAGLHQNHYREGCHTHIIANDGIYIKNWSDLGTENAYTAADIQLSHLVLDATRKLEADEVWKIVTVARADGVCPSDPLSTDDTSRIKRVKSRGNLHALKGEFRGPQGSTIGFQWDNAEPWTFTPATKVELHYDHSLGYKKLECKCEGADYIFQKQTAGPMALNPLWTCTGHIWFNSENVQDGLLTC